MRLALVLALVLTTTLPATAVAATPSPFVSTLPCGCVGFSLDLSTASLKGKVAMPPGTVDDGWYVVSTPLVETPGHHAAYSADREVGWAAPFAAANWIGDGSGLRASLDGIGASVSVTASVPGEYVYAIDFDLDLTQYASPTLGVSYAADDAVQFSLNDPAFAPGSILATGAGAGIVRSFSYSGGLFVHGPNTLYAKVTNAGGPTGLLVLAGVRAACLDRIDLATGVRAGVVDPVGATDDSWFLLRSPVSGRQAPAYSIPAWPSWVTSSSANWIGPVASPDGKTTPVAPRGLYVYEFDFVLACIPADCSRLILHLEFAADDGVEIRLNDHLLTSVGMTTGYAFLRPHLVEHSCSHFVVGTNVLTATVFNGGAWTGLIAQGSVTMDP